MPTPIDTPAASTVLPAGQAHDSRRQSRSASAGWGAAIGFLGGLIGLGGAEFRLPVLVGYFRLSTLEAVILNKAMSLTVVAAALLFRAQTIPFSALAQHLDVAFNLLLGSLAGAWWAAGHVIRMPERRLDQLVMLLLAGLAVLILGEALFGGPLAMPAPLAEHPKLRWGLGIAAGFGIGTVAALLGVAGGELLIPTIVLLFGLDPKIAGSLSLLVSLPTMIVSFSRYRDSTSFAVIGRETRLFRWMVGGSIAGAWLGGLCLGLIPTQALMLGLGALLLLSALKTFKHLR